MHHNFNTKVADKYGMICAVILENIYYWVVKNEVNNANFYNGYYWTYNSTTAYQKIFTYLSERQIRSALDKLKEEGLILVDNLNSIFNKGCNRTLWYTITKKGVNLLNDIESEDDPNPTTNMQKCQNDTAKMSNRNDKNATSILQKCQIDITKVQDNTNNKPYINTNNKLKEKEIHKEKEKTNVCEYIVNFWNSQGLLACETPTQDIIKAITLQLKIYTAEEICEYIRRHAEMLHSKFYMCHQWSLRRFLTNKNAMPDFTDTGEKWQEYQRWRKKQTINTPLDNLQALLIEEQQKEQIYDIN